MTIVKNDLLNIDIQDIRAHFPSLKEITYFNSGWTGPMPSSAILAIQDSINYQAKVGPSSKDGVKAQIQEVIKAKSKIAEYFFTQTENICLTTNTTLGINLALNGYDWSDKDEILTTKEEHASVLIPLYNLKERFGIKIKLIDIDFSDPVKSFTENISKQTKAAVFCHLFWTNGNLLPLNEIVKILREHEIISIIDGAQSAGAASFLIDDAVPDFYAVPGQKWLLGPVGTGFLYIRKELHGKRPPWPVVVGYESAGDAGDDSCYDLNCNWSAKKHAGLFEFGGLNNSLFTGLRESLDFASSVNKKINIYERIKLLSQYFINGLKEMKSVEVITSNQYAGLVAWKHKNTLSSKVVHDLWHDHKILIREIENFNYCRASLHFFNTKDEIDKLFSVLKDIR